MLDIYLSYDDYKIQYTYEGYKKNCLFKFIK